MADAACPVDGFPLETCMGDVRHVSDGITFTDSRSHTLPGGGQIARERIYYIDEIGVQRLLYAEGDTIPAAAAAAHGIVDGRLVLPDQADVAPTEKARRKRLVEDKALHPVTIQDKGALHG